MFWIENVSRSYYLDDEMWIFENGLFLLGGAGFVLGGILGAPKLNTPRPKLVVATEINQPWAMWANQFVEAHPKDAAKVPIPNGLSPATLVRTYRPRSSNRGYTAS